jgi:chromosome segregation ATPase
MESGDIAIQLEKIAGVIKNIETKLDEREKLYLSKFDSLEAKGDKTEHAVDSCWKNVHVLEQDQASAKERSHNIVEKINNIEENMRNIEGSMHGMRDLLIKVSVITTIITVAITAIVVKFIGG